MPLLSESMPYMDNLVAGLASAAIGGGLARTKTKRRPDESEEQYKRRLALNTTTGVVGGGAVGAALPSAFAALSGLYPQSYLEQLKNNPAKALKDAPGKAISETTGLVMNTAGPLGVAGAGLGAWQGSRVADANIKTEQAAIDENLATTKQQHLDSQNKHYSSTGEKDVRRNNALRGETKKIMLSREADFLASEARAKAFADSVKSRRWKARGIGGAAGLAGGALAENYFSGLLK